MLFDLVTLISIIKDRNCRIMVEFFKIDEFWKKTKSLKKKQKKNEKNVFFQRKKTQLEKKRFFSISTPSAMQWIGANILGKQVAPNATR